VRFILSLLFGSREGGKKGRIGNKGETKEERKAGFGRSGAREDVEAQDDAEELCRRI